MATASAELASRQSEVAAKAREIAALRKRARSWLARARGLVDEELRAWVGAQAEDFDALDVANRIGII